MYVKCRPGLRIRNSGFEKKIRNYSRIPSYSEVAVSKFTGANKIVYKQHIVIKNVSAYYKLELKCKGHNYAQVNLTLIRVASIFTWGRFESVIVFVTSF